jgi:ActR/RegA family two-component response regulator
VGTSVIEDELPLRAALLETLRAEGYRVQGAADGVAGLELACTEPFDLILLDVMMPGLDGYASSRCAGSGIGWMAETRFFVHPQNPDCYCHARTHEVL